MNVESMTRITHLSACYCATGLDPTDQMCAEHVSVSGTDTLIELFTGLLDTDHHHHK